ncbi:hypothetical protein AAG747_25400 [Rapidithrix thailandica]|uniref:DUF2892 domain-containing protein n=1 Tax=Rapidithrix thailandica TaxID=413964 RepID=A0AAW9S269_9BACT
MSTPFIPQHTYVVCTFQMSPTPQKLIANRSETSAFHNNEPLLTIQDKNLKEPFSCKSPITEAASWISFGAGIFVAALIFSTPIGWVFAGLALMVIVGGISLKKVITHQCTNPMDMGKWMLTHSTVKFDGYEAITLSSMLRCNTGSVLKPFLSESLATEAAKKIKINNRIELGVNTAVSFIAGLLFPSGWAGLSAKYGSGKAVYCLVKSNASGLAVIWTTTYLQREYMRTDESLEENTVYQSLNNEVDKSDWYGGTPKKPSDLSDLSDLQNFAEAVESGKATVGDLVLKQKLKKLAGLSRQVLKNNELANSLLDDLNAGKINHLKDAMTQFNSRRMNPTMVQEGKAVTSEAFRKGMGKTGAKLSLGALFFIAPSLATWFSEETRRDFAEVAVQDINKAMATLAEKGNSVVTKNPL